MDAAHIEKLYREHGWHVYRRSLRILGSEEEARDLCQDLFVKLLHGRAGSCDPTKMTAWLYRSTTNLCIDRLRTRKRHDSELLEALVADTAVESEVGRRELVQALLPHLSRFERQLLILRYVDECTLEEMETICGKTRKTVSKHLRRVEAKAQAIVRPYLEKRKTS